MEYSEKLQVKQTVAVIVTYNRKELLEKCINALLHSEIPASVLVVDNASTDGTDTMVHNKFETEVIYHRNHENRGGAGGFVDGINLAAKLDCKYLWIMDDDTIVNNNTLSELLRAENIIGHKYGWLSSLALWKDGSACKMNTQTLDSRWGEEGQLVQQGVIRANYASFVSLLVPRENVIELGLPYEEYFIWGDDSEYTKRLSSKYHGYLVMNSIVTHMMKNNEGASDLKGMEDPQRIERMYYAIRNSIHTGKINGKKEYYKEMASVYYEYYLIFHSNCFMRNEKLRIMRKAIRAGKNFKPTLRFVN